ncbi:MAG TPA: prepilin-type N-terminal cleavage/methylation domain-containing protein [Actinophytocola sp.]|jgi:prepilin-type N-terminal cleavage/methylation domain-containing protein|uniref:PulJ/GspJ family protein n=1 Tax=Actinophytocola sp. TaxID=1872138 RepID=UPI002E015E1B|nr:prepilin-type N-terminal cleavage/methylation domain-containing protein [Actinophytocola sp.]
MLRRDEGFTLIELLVAVVLIGVIMVPLTEVVISYLRNTDTTTARQVESHDQQIAAAYWQQDVSSIGVRSPYDAASQSFPLQRSVNTVFPCALPGGASPVVVLAWNQYDSFGSPTTISVAYATITGKTQLIRVHCMGSTVDSNEVIARALDPSVTPAVACLTGTGGTSCTGSGSDVPQSINLKFTVKDPSGKGQQYVVSLDGQRRQT